MRRSLWVMMAMAFAGILALTWGSQSMLRTATGVEEGLILQDTLRGAGAGIFAADPPLRVHRIPGSPEWPGWRWRVEATVAPGAGKALLDRSLERLVPRALGTRVGGSPPAGVMVVLHEGGGRDRTLLYDGNGRPVGGAGGKGSPQAPAAPPGSPVPAAPETPR